MSGRTGRPYADTRAGDARPGDPRVGDSRLGDQRAGDLRAKMPLLDRLLDDEPAKARDDTLSVSQAHADLLRGVRRDLEALLNARRPWKPLPAGHEALIRSPLGFGLPDFAAGAFNQQARRERLREEIRQALTLFERRLSHVEVDLLPIQLSDPTLRLRIRAQLNVDPAPMPVGFDMTVDPRTDEFEVRQGRDV